MKQLLLLFAFCAFSFQSEAQTVSLAGQLGWIIPGGSGVDSINYDVGGGIAYMGDVLYHLGEEDEAKIGVGLGYYGAILAGGIFDAYGLSLVGVKGVYELNPSGFTPFFGLTLGLSKLETPEISVNGTVTSPSNSASGFGLAPQVGIKFGGGFYLAGDYIVPTNYKIDEINKDGGVGGLLISLGYRRKFSF